MPDLPMPHLSSSSFAPSLALAKASTASVSVEGLSARALSESSSIPSRVQSEVEMWQPKFAAQRRSFSCAALDNLLAKSTVRAQLSGRLADLVQEAGMQSAPFISPALKDMRDESYAQGMVVVRRMPNRGHFFKQAMGLVRECPFCRKKATAFLEEYSYLGLKLSQNLGPYDPNSFLLRPPAMPSGGHETQADTVQFLARLGAKVLSDLPQGMTLFSNQLAGNSQAHLHLQLVGCLPPVSTLLSDENKNKLLGWSATGLEAVEYAVLDARDTAGSVLPLSHFSGCLLKGAPEGVAQAAVHYLTTAEEAGSNRFNFTAWRDPLSNQAAMFIVLRNPKSLRSDANQLPHTVGALSTAGLVMDESSPADAPQVFDYVKFAHYMEEKTLPVCRSAFPVSMN